MKNIFKYLIISFLLIVIIIGIGIAYIQIKLPATGPPPDLEVNTMEIDLERGEYLANHVMGCIDCHSQRDWTRYSGPVVKGTEGMGGEVFDENMGFPGRFVASNITPSNLADWSDGEIFRAITSGVSRDGRPLFPIMPYHNFGKLDKSDIYAVIAYIRTLKPIDHQTQPSRVSFPMNLIIRTMPSEPAFSTMPSKEDLVAYGGYLVTAAGCYDCHTRQENGKFVGEPYAGGMKFVFPDGKVVVSKNITPDETGIKHWTEEAFVARFKMYADSAYVLPEATDVQTVMPWTIYAGMTETDLKAIYAYLMSLPPVKSSQEI